jgi:membrane associated rhomboid family serine protease
MLDSVHRSIGASTAVFATLGLVAGFVWRGKFMHQDRWAYRLGPIVGGLALLAYTGTGDANTDIGAHLLGFACGFATGMLISMTPVPLSSATMQRTTGAVAFLVVVGAWLVAF